VSDSSLGTLSWPHSPQRTTGSANVTVKGTARAGSAVTDRVVARIGRSNVAAQAPHRADLASPAATTSCSRRARSTAARSSSEVTVPGAGAQPAPHPSTLRCATIAVIGPIRRSVAGRVVRRRASPQRGQGSLTP